MTDIVERLQDDESNEPYGERHRAAETITTLRAENAALRDFAQWASRQYENQNLGHGDFRVEAKARADDALAGRVNHA